MFFNKIKEYILSVYQQSFTSCEVSTYLVVAILATTFPFVGITTIAVLGIAKKYNFNIPLVILITYSLEPLRFIVFLPLSNLGSVILRLSNRPRLTLNGLNKIVQTNFLDSLGLIVEQFGFALIGWLLVVVPLAYPLFIVTKAIVAFCIPKIKKCVKVTPSFSENR